MESLLFSVVVITAAAAFSAVAYLFPQFKRKVLGGKADYLQTIYLFAVPPIFLISGFWLISSMLQRPNIGITPISDSSIIFLLSLFGMMGFMGGGIHASSKCVYWHLKKYKDSKAFKINEFFHSQLSHHLIYYSAMLVSLVLVVAEINHPTASPLPSWNEYLLGFLGSIFGLSVAASIIWSGYWRSNLLLLPGTLAFAALLILKYSLNLHLRPLSIFLISWMFTAFLVLLLISLVISKKGFVERFGKYWAD